jgi:hypothetical protein
MLVVEPRRFTLDRRLLTLVADAKCSTLDVSRLTHGTQRMALAIDAQRSTFDA